MWLYTLLIIGLIGGSKGDREHLSSSSSSSESNEPEISDSLEQALKKHTPMIRVHPAIQEHRKIDEAVDNWFQRPSDQEIRNFRNKMRGKMNKIEDSDFKQPEDSSESRENDMIRVRGEEIQRPNLDDRIGNWFERPSQEEMMEFRRRMNPKIVKDDALIRQPVLVEDVAADFDDDSDVSEEVEGNNQKFLGALGQILMNDKDYDENKPEGNKEIKSNNKVNVRMNNINLHSVIVGGKPERHQPAFGSRFRDFKYHHDEMEKQQRHVITFNFINLLFSLIMILAMAYSGKKLYQKCVPPKNVEQPAPPVTLPPFYTPNASNEKKVVTTQ